MYTKDFDPYSPHHERLEPLTGIVRASYVFLCSINHPDFGPIDTYVLHAQPDVFSHVILVTASGPTLFDYESLREDKFEFNCEVIYNDQLALALGVKLLWKECQKASLDRVGQDIRDKPLIDDLMVYVPKFFGAYKGPLNNSFGRDRGETVTSVNKGRRMLKLFAHVSNTYVGSSLFYIRVTEESNIANPAPTRKKRVDVGEYIVKNLALLGDGDKEIQITVDDGTVCKADVVDGYIVDFWSVPDYPQDLVHRFSSLADDRVRHMYDLGIEEGRRREKNEPACKSPAGYEVTSP